MTPPPPAPSTSSPTTFPALADALVAWMLVFVGEVAAALGLLTSINQSRIVDVACTAAVNLASGLAAGQVIDGITLTTGMRVLCISQSTGSQNGIYDVPASGAASRSVDANSNALIPSGLLISVTRGNQFAGFLFHHTTAPGFTLNTTALTFTGRNGNKTVSTGVLPNFGAGSMGSGATSATQLLPNGIAGQLIIYENGPIGNGGVSLACSQTGTSVGLGAPSYATNSGSSDIASIQAVAGGFTITAGATGGTTNFVWILLS